MEAEFNVPNGAIQHAVRMKSEKRVIVASASDPNHRF
jgi:hypothetical protein